MAIRNKLQDLGAHPIMLVAEWLKHSIERLHLHMPFLS